jgi:hypothetical protein
VVAKPSTANPEPRVDSHENARTTPNNRMLIVGRLSAGQAVGAVATALVTLRTVRKWRDRFAAEGEPGPRQERFGRSSEKLASEKLAGEIEQLELRLDDLLTDIAGQDPLGVGTRRRWRMPRPKVRWRSSPGQTVAAARCRSICRARPSSISLPQAAPAPPAAARCAKWARMSRKSWNTALAGSRWCAMQRSANLAVLTGGAGAIRLTDDLQRAQQRIALDALVHQWEPEGAAADG